MEHEKKRLLRRTSLAGERSLERSEEGSRGLWRELKTLTEAVSTEKKMNWKLITKVVYKTIKTWEKGGGGSTTESAQKAG